MNGLENRDDHRKIVALSLIARVGAVTYKKLTEKFGDIDSILKATSKDLTSLKNLPKNLQESLKNPELLEKAEKEITKAQKSGVDIISLLDPEYPEELREIYDAPMVLYVRGHLPIKGTPAVAIVGSRKASLYGVRTAKSIASDLAKSGVVVVSGLALGIDSAAHEGALKQNGVTLAVLGGGLSRLYPSQNKKMAERIVKNGAVISEYPMEMSPRPEYFPMRNRIISGLSRAVLVVEAAQKSGALITADTALEQNRDVFAVPGNADASKSQGTNALLKQGAKLVTCATDILEELNIADKSKARSADEISVNIKKMNLSPEEEKLYSLLDNEPLQIDTLIEQSGLTISRTMSSLMSLEMKGAVKELPGKNFIRNS
ncbi:MAG: DNA protecting protein DprA [Candidatus Omnitrophica bacterium CG1_02_46_14]|nr:MAG: DNA protecting protein DprA [Candidatus Omnitrophica bacterium CG1_02_46_14]